MPHLVILYTPNLEAKIDMGAVCRRMADAMLSIRDEHAAQVFPTGGTRVFAYPSAHYAVADGGTAGKVVGGSGDYGFVYMNVRMAKGRSAFIHRAVGTAVSETAKTLFAALIAKEHLGLTVQVDEGHEVFDAKHSSLHPLFAAAKTRVQIGHFSKRFPQMSIADGYRISRAWVQMQIDQGSRVIGHKIGLTSRAMQVSSQIDEPDFGTLLDHMLYTCSPGQILPIPMSNFIAPRVEVEFAFVLKAPLRGPNVTLKDVLKATEYVTPAIEIIDARVEQFDRHTKAPRKVFDTISDNAANGGIVLGALQANPLTTDLPWCGAILRQNGVVEETGLAAGVQGHPAIGVAWLANKLAPWGESLAVGEIVLAGSFTKPANAKLGDEFDADYGPLGKLQFKFV
jgi:2-oxo-hept-3-ene-1,7-dioate hydratase